MAPESYLTVGEFERAQRQQTALFLTHMSSISNKQDETNRVVAALATKIDERTTKHQKDAKKTASGWAAAVAAAFMLIIEALKAWAK